MKFYVRKFKDDFIGCNTVITTNSAGFFTLSWYKGITRTTPQGQQTTYPNSPTLTDIITTTKILLEKKTNLPLDNPHQLIACGVTEGDVRLSYVDMLKYTYHVKGSTGFFKNSSRIEPIMYVLVPFSDAPIDDWTFILVATSLIVDGVAVTETFDIDIDRTIADTCNATLPGIVLTKDGTTITAQLTDSTGTPVAKSNIDIYFETTAGYLTKSRGTTDSNGIATTQVVGAEEGKVKAGFKYFSGKTQITI